MGLIPFLVFLTPFSGVLSPFLGFLPHFLPHLWVFYPVFEVSHPIFSVFDPILGISSPVFGVSDPIFGISDPIFGIFFPHFQVFDPISPVSGVEGGGGAAELLRGSRLRGPSAHPRPHLGKPFSREEILLCPPLIPKKFNFGRPPTPLSHLGSPPGKFRVVSPPEMRQEMRGVGRIWGFTLKNLRPLPKNKSPGLEFWGVLRGFFGGFTPKRV